MQKINYNLLILFLILFLDVNIFAQTTILDETLLTQESFNTFTTLSVKGDQSWYFDERYGAICSGYSGGQSYENEDWLISPSMDLSEKENVKLTFQHTRGNAAVMNVGVDLGWYKVFATAHYTGNPETTQWIELEGINHSLEGAWYFTSSGDIAIPEAAKSENTHIAFRYLCSETESATWEIKNVLVTGEFTPVQGHFFKIITWNVEHFGSTCDGPEDEELQLINVANAIRLMEADIVCLQEVTQSTSCPTINNLLSFLGSEWGGNIVAGNPTNCSHNQGIVYRKSKVQFVNSLLLREGNPSQGNSYYYNWTFGRYPALYNVNLLVESELIPVSLVNIHAKAMAEEENYIRRKGASEALKTILDGTQYNAKNLIIIGDFNDYLIGSSCYTCGESPYQNFMNDTENYRGISQNLQDDGCWYYSHVIDNMIISNELFDNYVTNSVMQERSLLTTIDEYCSTTSDHLPVSAFFEFFPSIIGINDLVLPKNEASLHLYPNPVKDELKIEISTPFHEQNIEIYDLAGKLVFKTTTNSHVIHVSALPSGIYVLKVGHLREKFVKM